MVKSSSLGHHAENRRDQSSFEKKHLQVNDPSYSFCAVSRDFTLRNQSHQEQKQRDGRGREDGIAAYLTVEIIAVSGSVVLDWFSPLQLWPFIEGQLILPDPSLSTEQKKGKKKTAVGILNLTQRHTYNKGVFMHKLAIKLQLQIHICVAAEVQKRQWWRQRSGTQKIRRPDSCGATAAAARGDILEISFRSIER